MTARSPSELPPFPDGTEASFGRWTSWAKGSLGRSQFGALDHDVMDPDERIPLAWRALIAAWADLKATPDSTYKAAQRFFLKATELPGPVFRAGELLLERSMRHGSTTPDVLYLAAAFAWPLRCVSPKLSRQAWAYLVDAPWQTSSVVLTDLVSDFVKGPPIDAPRRLIDLVSLRLEHEQTESAIELLEGLVLAWSSKASLAELRTPQDLRKALAVPDIELAFEQLARLYVERGDVQVHAREVIRKAAALTSSDELRAVLNERVWDRPLVETYQDLKDTKIAAFEAQLRAALDAGQPHHARRLAESLLARRLCRVVVGDPQANVQKSLKLFAEAPIQKLAADREARVAAEQLAMLYARTNYATQLTRDFARRLVMEPLFTGKGSALEHSRGELESFINKNDPYHLLMRQEREFAAADARLNDDERRARDDVSEWWVSKAFTKDRGIAEAAMSAITGPVAFVSDLLKVQDICEAALRTAFHLSARYAGDLEVLARRSEAERLERGVGQSLARLAREATNLELAGAVATSGLLGVLPPGFSLLASAADLGVLLFASFRTIARVATVFGLQAASDEGQAFAADAFSLGVSSPGGEGMLAYLSRPKDPAPEAITIGGVSYGPKWLAAHLWTSTTQTPRVIAEQLIANTARLLGVSLSERQIVKIIPVGGAILNGLTAANFIKDIREAAIHLASRDALLHKARGEKA